MIYVGVPTVYSSSDPTNSKRSLTAAARFSVELPSFHQRVLKRKLGA
jgi:hypothetical protein